MILKFVCIKYPGYVKEIDKVIEMIGGLKRIEKVLSIKNDENKSITLSYGNNDPNLIPLSSKLACYQSVIIRIKKHKITNQLKLEVIGLAKTIFEFRSIFDFQLPTPVKFRNAINESYVSSSYNNDTSIHFIPTSLSIIEEPYEFTLPRRLKQDEQLTTTNMMMNDSKIDEIFLVRKKNKLTHIHFTTEELPQYGIDFSKINLNTNIIEKTLLQKVIDIFNERKICTKKYIQSKINLPKEYMKKLVHCVAFFWIDGPWARSWNIYGYDPRIDNNSALLQTFVCRIPSKIKKSSDNTIESMFDDEDLLNISHDIIATSTTGIFQLIDIKIPSLKNYIEECLTRMNDKCDPINGWFENNFYKNIRQLIHQL